jgi:hypothetical protein
MRAGGSGPRPGMTGKNGVMPLVSRPQWIIG